MSAFSQNPLVNQTSTSNQLSESRNYSATHAHKKSVFFEIRRNDIKLVEEPIPTTNGKSNMKKYQSIQQQEHYESRIEKRRIFSPVRTRNIY